jgi:FdhD protein
LSEAIRKRNPERVGRLCEEAPLRIRYNGREAALILCTPLDLNGLVVGWLYGQGLIEGPEEILTLGVCKDLNDANVVTSPDRWEERKGWRQIFTSGCGGGTMLASLMEDGFREVRDDLVVEQGRLKALIGDMLARAEIYRAIGGIHCAALADGQKILSFSEDVGRHNALDKVIGKALLEGVDLGRVIALTTGRISSEMALKLARAGIPIGASLSTATTLAAEIAARAGITLVTRATRRSPAVYGKDSRLILDEGS